jgi:imidazole glycerol-phosphate synthase subunit HisH
MITIIDYGMGNLGSIQNMFRRLGVESDITGDKEKIGAATKLLLPGVGAFDAAVMKINDADLMPLLNKKVLNDKVPVLGICLGMQLLTKSSEEGTLPGFGWVDAITKKFKFNGGEKLKVPHMGWNEAIVKRNSQLNRDLSDHPRFYFVHSYYVEANDPEDVLMSTQYGREFHSVIQHENIYGAQFHPEKSHKFGMKFLGNFASL